MIQPLGQRILVKRDAAAEKSQGGLFLPGNAQDKPQSAVVIALGTGGKTSGGEDFKFTVKVGDRVLTTRYGGTDVELEGEKYQIMQESDVLAIL